MTSFYKEILYNVLPSHFTNVKEALFAKQSVQ